jgi:hypothetical protein
MCCLADGCCFYGGVLWCAVLCCGVLQAMWGFARMEYRPPNQLLDAVLKVGGAQGALSLAWARGWAWDCGLRR